VRIDSAAEAAAAWKALVRAPALLEGFVAFEDEFSIILCRAESGETVFWPAPKNVHVGGILDSSAVPAPEQLEPHIAEATELAGRVATALDYVGVLTLEFFADARGPVFNEMAPRVHNSGHWTIEGSLTSQFENHIRAVCGLPLGGTSLTASRIEMRNLLGEEANRWGELLADRSAHLHLYGKGTARPGRKMGHVTRLLP
jgi:5-(carboxyamino)imidazole ribonucleotide synthase